MAEPEQLAGRPPLRGLRRVRAAALGVHALRPTAAQALLLVC